MTLKPGFMKTFVLILILLAMVLIACSSLAENLFDKQDNQEVVYDGSGYYSHNSDYENSPIQPHLTITKYTMEGTDFANKEVKISLTISGADQKASSTGFHIFYDTRLTLKKNDDEIVEWGDATRRMSRTCVDKGNGHVFVATAAATDALYSGVYCTLTFITPDNAKAGDLYPIGIDSSVSSPAAETLFMNSSGNDDGKLMEDYFFKKGITNGYIKLLQSDAGVSIIEGTSGTKAYGDAAFTLNGTASTAGSNGTWKWTSSNNDVAAISNETTATPTVTLLAVSSTPVTITASYSSDSAVGSAEYILTVTPKSITIQGVTASERDYDPNNLTVSLTGGTLSGVCDGDRVTADLTNAVGTIASADAGTAKSVTVTGITLSGADAEKYVLTQPTDVTVNINKLANPGVITPEAILTVRNSISMLEYVTGAEGNVSFEIKEDTTKECKLDDDMILTSGDTAGTCIITATISGDDIYKEKTGDIEVTITDKETEPLEVTQQNAVYGGTLADPVWTRPDDVPEGQDPVISYSGKTAAGASYGPDSKKPMEAGSYTVTVTEESMEFVYTGSADFTISKADSAITAAPKAREGLVCNGAAQELVTAGTVTGGTMQYALGTDSTTTPASGWSASIPKGTDAGTYYVWYKVAGDANHLDTNPACVSATIQEAPVNPEPETESQPEPETVTEQVTLKGIKIKSTKSVSNSAVEVSWKKLSKKHRKAAKMIEIQVSTDKNFNRNVITKKVKSGKTSAKISHLERGKKYYIRIRVFTEDGNIKYVSKWSKKKSFQIVKLYD